MKKQLLMMAIALSLGAFAVKAEAMPLAAGSGVGQAADSLNVVEKSQYVWGGRRYCWYPDGWRGPGWYWCGYHMRQGFGWGGGVGWRGWNHGGGPRGPRAVVVGPRGGVGVVGPRGGVRIVGPRGGGRHMGGGPRRRH